MPGDRFERYLSQVNRFPLLSEEEEHLLARSWRERRERRALERLVTSHLRLVARLALGYRGYGLALSDLVSEGTLGLLRAAERFDPDRRVRLSTYASWWIRAAIQEYILRSWSLVKIGGGAERRRLFFGLRSLRNRLEQYDERLGEGADRAGAMAKILDVDESVVREMQQRLGERDLSLHAPLGAADGGDDGGAVWLDRIPADEDTPEALAEAEEESRLRRRFLEEALEESVRARPRDSGGAAARGGGGESGGSGRAAWCERGAGASDREAGVWSFEAAFAGDCGARGSGAGAVDGLTGTL